MIREEILDKIDRSDRRLSCNELIRELRASYDKKEIKREINKLIFDSELMFVQFFGTTYIEKSYNRPVKISDKVVIKPPMLKYNASKHELVVSLNQGCSFGRGNHPTTRLSVKGIEYLFLNKFIELNGNKKSIGLDIGTGSGILAIVSVLFGVDYVTAIDTDSYSLFESQKNVELNGFHKAIMVSSKNLYELNECYNLITANLRFPTLKTIASKISKLLRTKGVLVLSGFRFEEKESLLKKYNEEGFDLVHTESEKEWQSAVFQKSVQ